MSRSLIDLLWREHPDAPSGGSRGPRARVATGTVVDTAGNVVVGKDAGGRQSVLLRAQDLLSRQNIDAVGASTAQLQQLLVALTSLAAEQRQHIARQATITGGAVALGFLFLGASIFKALGISASDFQIAGGLILFILAIVLLSGGLDSTTVLAIAVVVVLPCVPEMAMTRPWLTIEPRACARLSTGIPRCRAAATSGWSGETALVITSATAFST